MPIFIEKHLNTPKPPEAERFRGRALFRFSPSILDRGFFREDRADHFGRELRAAVVGVEPVLFLLDVGQLRVAEGKNLRVVEQRVGEPLQPFEKLLFGLGRVAVTPCTLVHAPADAAVFADEERLAGRVGLALVALHRLDVGAVQDERSEVLDHRRRFLLVVVDVVNIAFDVEVPAGVDDGTGRVDRFGRAIDEREQGIVLTAMVLIPRFVEGALHESKRNS